MPESPSLLPGILNARCPKCGKGKIFQNKGVFPLGSSLKTVDHCPVCGQKIKTGNDNAPGINYALSVVVYVLGFILYACIWDITYKDNSFIYSFMFATAIVILCQPWLMRLSKTIYIYMFIKFH
jgi:uncharacterized protein (DUF983 family)